MNSNYTNDVAAEKNIKLAFHITHILLRLAAEESQQQDKFDADEFLV